MRQNDEEYNIIKTCYIRLLSFLKKTRLLLFFIAIALIGIGLFFGTGILSVGYSAYVGNIYIGRVMKRGEILNLQLSGENFESLNLYPCFIWRGQTTPDSQIKNNLKLAAGQTQTDIPFVADDEKNSEEIISVSVAKAENADDPIIKGIASGVFARPIQGVVTSNFGERWGSIHKGTDFAGNTGDNVTASDGGIVTYADCCGSFGNLIIIDHQNGYETYYAHLSAIYVNCGDNVSKGDIIGAVGDTGNSRGPHLHFEIREGGNSKDPLAFLQN